MARSTQYAWIDLAKRFGRTYVSLVSLGSRFQELMPLRRRMTASLVLWLGLLGLGSPAFACSMAAVPNGDCCPEGSQSPCTDGGANYDTAKAASCCNAVPAASPTGSVNAGLNAPDLKPNSLSPDSPVVPSWMACAATVNPPDVVPRSAFSSRTDATLTYLRTGRLRL